MNAALVTGQHRLTPPTLNYQESRIGNKGSILPFSLIVLVQTQITGRHALVWWGKPKGLLANEHGDG